MKFLATFFHFSLRIYLLANEAYFERLIYVNAHAHSEAVLQLEEGTASQRGNHYSRLWRQEDWMALEQRLQFAADDDAISDAGYSFSTSSSG